MGALVLCAGASSDDTDAVNKPVVWPHVTLAQWYVLRSSVAPHYNEAALLFLRPVQGNVQEFYSFIVDLLLFATAVGSVTQLPF